MKNRRHALIRNLPRLKNLQDKSMDWVCSYKIGSVSQAEVGTDWFGCGSDGTCRNV